MNTPHAPLSKTRVMDWLQCPKKLYLAAYKRQEETIDPGTQRVFDEGNRIGQIARDLYPDGIMIEADWRNLREASQLTSKHLQESLGRPLFEATFVHEGVLVRADILVPQPGGYRIIEVKASTEVKEPHVQDTAIQTWVIGNHIDVLSVSLMHVDREFCYDGASIDKLLVTEDISEQVNRLITTVPEWVRGAREALAGDEPQVDLGACCRNPYGCTFQAYCRRNGPAYPVDILPGPGGKRVAQNLLNAGCKDLVEADPNNITPACLRIYEASKSGIPFRDPAVKREIDSIPFPRYYLDFETINPAIPLWAGTHPFEQIPFQWSCHVEDTSGEIERFEFLDTSGGFPARNFAESLLGLIKPGAPVLVYSRFEKQILNSLANRFPDLSAGLERIAEQLYDLLPLVQNFYYHPAQMGSYSLKVVLPALVPAMSYALIPEVQDGIAAQLAFLEVIDPATNLRRKDVLRAAMMQYCAYDTLAMVEVVRALRGNA